MFNLDDYETVEERLIKYWKDHPDGRIDTLLVESTLQRFIVKASVYRTEVDAQAWTTGYAEETISTRGVNSTSALENCETSAIGRALANAGMAGTDVHKRPSREEMSKVQRSTPTPAPRPAGNMADANGVTVKGKQYGDLPDWLVLEAFQAGVSQVWDNRDKVAGTKRPWFKDVNGDKAFWPPRGTADPVVELFPIDEAMGEEEPF